MLLNVLKDVGYWSLHLILHFFIVLILPAVLCNYPSYTTLGLVSFYPSSDILLSMAFLTQRCYSLSVSAYCWVLHAQWQEHELLHSAKVNM